jgi:hypothetical protein
MTDDTQARLDEIDREVEAYHRRVLGHTLDMLAIDQQADKAMSESEGDEDAQPAE